MNTHACAGVVANAAQRKKLLKLAKDDPNADNWTVLLLPALRVDMSNPDDPREIDGVLWPRAYPLKELMAIKAQDPRGFSALYQQNPMTPELSRFKREWWKRHRELPPDQLRKGMFIDCANKAGTKNDYTAIATWTECTVMYYLNQIWRKKVTFPDLLRAVKDIYYAQKPDAIVIEDAANGTALIQELQANTSLPVIPWKCENKEIRAERAQPTAKAGKLSLPEGDPTIGDFIDEHEMFPNGANDDQVDTTGIMLDYFRNDKPVPRIRAL